MKVLHIATGAKGGAFLAAKRLVEIQNLMGIEAHLLTSSKLFTHVNGKLVSTPTKPLVVLRLFLNRFLGRLLTLLQRVISKEDFGLLTIHSISNLGRNRVQLDDYNVVHIHNWYNILSIRDFRKISESKPTVLTLHDQRILTGGCHYSMDCPMKSQNCLTCPQVKLKIFSTYKARKELHSVVETAEKLVITAPSSWLLSQARLEFCKNQKIRFYQVGNVLTKDIKTTLVEKPDTEKFEIVFSAAHINAGVKGLPVLINALKIIREKYPNESKNLTLTIIGGGDLDSTSFDNVNRIEYLASAQLHNELSRYDLCIVPSTQDNAPSIILESQMIGIPVLATTVGGIPEMIIDGHTGFLTEPVPVQMAEKLIEVMALKGRRLSQIAENAKLFALVRTEPNQIFSKWLEIYKELSIAR